MPESETDLICVQPALAIKIVTIFRNWVVMKIQKVYII